MLLPNVIGAVLLTAAVGGVTAVAVMDQPDPARTEVARVIDGDTIEVRTGDHVETVRLLNVDAPEVADCLYQQATDHLGSLLPVGTEVTLEYDVERTDRYGRTLAGVVKADGTLVNAEMARAGLAGVISTGQNVRFHAQVSSAMWEASTQKRALHSTDVSCTAPAQVQAVAKAAETAAPPLTGTPAELTAAGDVATAALAHADVLLAPRGLIWTVLSAGDQSAFRALVTAARATLGQREKDLRAAATAAVAREAEEKRKAEAAAEAAAAEARRQAEAAAAEEQRRAEVAAEEQRRRDQEQQWNPPAPDTKYTGKRCYNPGGKTYRPC